MARQISFEGRTFEVPDDATDDEIASILEASSPTTTTGVAPTTETSLQSLLASAAQPFVKPSGLDILPGAGPAVNLLGKGTEAFQGALLDPEGVGRIEAAKRGFTGQREIPGEELLKAVGIDIPAQAQVRRETLQPILGERGVDILEGASRAARLGLPEETIPAFAAEAVVDPLNIPGVGVARGLVRGAAKGAEATSQAAKAARVGLGTKLSELFGSARKAAGVAAEKAAFEAPEFVAETAGEATPAIRRALASTQKIEESVLSAPSKIGAETVFKPKNETKIVSKFNELNSKLQATLDIPEVKLAKKAEEVFGSPIIKVGNKEVPLAQKIVSTRGVIVDPEVARQLNTVDDIPAFQTAPVSLTDPIRVAERLDKSQRGVTKRVIIEPVEKALADEVTEANQTAQEFSNLLKAAKYDPSDEAKNRALFRLAENRADDIPLEDFNKITSEDRQLVAWTRQKYDDYIDRLNANRSRFNLEPVKRRDDYVTHTQRLSLADELGIDLARASDDVQAWLHPSKPSFAFEKARKGGKFTEDLAEAFESYFPAAIRSIHRTAPSSVARAYIDFLPPNAHSFFTKWLDEAVLNKPTAIDSWLGPIKGFLAKGLNLTSKGAILGRLTTAALQPSTFGITTARTGVANSLRGLKASLSNEGKELFSTLSRQGAIRNLELDLDTSTLGKFEKFAGWLNTSLDRFMVRHAFLSAFSQAKHNLGYTDEAARLYADNIAGKTQAIYNKVFTPQIQRSVAARAGVGQFQTFMFNLWNQMTKDIKTASAIYGPREGATQLGKMAVGMLATNEIYKALGLPEPFDTVVPFTGTAKFGPAILPRGVRGVTKVVAGATTGDLQLAKEGLNDLKKTAPALVPGGNQIVNTVKGVIAVNKGYTEVGREKIPIKGTTEQVRAIAFGPTFTKASQESFRQKREKQREKLLKDLLE